MTAVEVIVQMMMFQQDCQNNSHATSILLLTAYIYSEFSLISCNASSNIMVDYRVRCINCIFVRTCTYIRLVPGNSGGLNDFADRVVLK